MSVDDSLMCSFQILKATKKKKWCYYLNIIHIWKEKQNISKLIFSLEWFDWSSKRKSLCLMSVSCILWIKSTLSIYWEYIDYNINNKPSICRKKKMYRRTVSPLRQRANPYLYASQRNETAKNLKKDYVLNRSLGAKYDSLSTEISKV